MMPTSPEHHAWRNRHRKPPLKERVKRFAMLAMDQLERPIVGLAFGGVMLIVGFVIGRWFRNWNW